MNNAELIARTLKRAGIARGFGVPSGNVLPLMEAMRTAGLPFVLTAHEGSAGFAAEVSGRMTGAADAPPEHYFGVKAVGVRDEAGLAAALDAALAADGPTVIEARVDPSHYMQTVYD